MRRNGAGESGRNDCTRPPLIRTGPPCLIPFLSILCHPCPLSPAPTCTMLGWASELLMAASIMSIFSRFSLPLMDSGRMMALIAT